jgi:hypothetical protein
VWGGGRPGAGGAARVSEPKSALGAFRTLRPARGARSAGAARSGDANHPYTNQIPVTTITIAALRFR